jgi:hypothetical protein
MGACAAVHRGRIGVSALTLSNRKPMLRLPNQLGIRDVEVPPLW